MSIMTDYPVEEIPGDNDHPVPLPLTSSATLDHFTTDPGEEAGAEGGIATDTVAVSKPGSADDPLYIINEPANSFAAGQVPLSSIPVKAVIGSALRQAVLVTNTSNANTVYLGASAGQVNNGGGYILNPLTSLTLPISADIWATASAATTLTFITMDKVTG